MSLVRRAPWFLLVLVLTSALLFVTRIDGVFTIDEDSYLASVVSLRAGRLTVPGTEGLPANPELLAFDAAPRSRTVATTPVASSSPPLYALIALPFSYLAWPGLVALQILSFTLCAWLVFRAAELDAKRRRTPWLAAAAFVLAGYSLEYAQGVWPHMLAVCLCTGALYLALRVRHGDPAWTAAAAGLLAGLAVGVRYQNLVLATLIGVGILVWTRGRRLAASLLFAAGMLVPLAASSAINAQRLGSWNPVSKGERYLSVAGGRVQSNRIVDGAVSTFTRVVDQSAYPEPHAESVEALWRKRDLGSGAYLIAGALKKAWLQSAPWMLLALIGLALAWRPGGAGELRRLSLLVAGVLGLFALYGFQRYDGLCFNERYLLELVPFMALALAWSLDDLDWSVRSAVAGGLLAGLGLAAVLSLEPDLSTRLRLLAWPPLLLAGGLAIAWLLRSRGVGLLLGACLGWALAAHLLDDLPASRRLRAANAARLAAVEAAIPATERSAIFAYGGDKDALGPLTLERDVVIVDPWIDDSAGAPVLLDALRAQGRTVYFLNGIPSTIISLPTFRDLAPEAVPADIRLFRVRASTP
jgi:hypothetical protein